MYIKFLGFLLMFAFSINVMANPIVFIPNFSGQPVAIPSGTPLIPLCNNPMDPSCIPQWSQQAVPLAVYPQGVSSPQFQFFLPAFMPTGRGIQENPERSDEWKVFTPSFSSSFRSERRFQKSAAKKIKDRDSKRTFYRDKSDPDKIKIVETDKKGKKTIKEKQGSLNSEEDIKKAKTVVQSPEGDKSWEVFTPPFQEEIKPVKDQKIVQTGDAGATELSDKLEDLTKESTAPFKIYQHKIEPDQFAVVYQNKQGGKKVESVEAVFVPENNIINKKTEDTVTEKTTSGAAETTQEEVPSTQKDATIPGSTQPETPDDKVSVPHTGSSSVKKDTAQAGSQPARSASDQGTTGQMPKESKKKQSPDPVSKPVSAGKESARGVSPANQKKQVSKPQASSIRDISNIQTKGDTPAVPAQKSPDQDSAHKGDLLQPRESDFTQDKCIKFNQSKEAKTEAGFCFECVKDGEDTVLSSLIKDQKFISALKGYMKEVTSKRKKIITGKQVLRGNSTQKICDPKSSLKAIIDNFERTCPKPYNNFKAFAEKTQCEFCKKGVPPEIMMSIVSIESTGKCPAHNKSGEDSVGLCQVNSEEHKCKDLKGRIYRKGTSANQQCLKNPINSCSKGADILTTFYKGVNDKGPNPSACNKSWLDMNVTEKDAWRRSVSSYNSGSSWVTRAIKSVRNSRTLTDTKYLKKNHKKYRTDKMSWEKLRVAYFVEKLSQGAARKGSCSKEECKIIKNKLLKKARKNNNKCMEKCKNSKECVGKCRSVLKGKKQNASQEYEKCLVDLTEKGTGRRISCTISNLAHTEAVLGRNNSTPSMVDIWALYFKDPKNKASCSK